MAIIQPNYGLSLVFADLIAIPSDAQWVNTIIYRSNFQNHTCFHFYDGYRIRQSFGVSKL